MFPPFAAGGVRHTYTAHGPHVCPSQVTKIIDDSHVFPLLLTNRGVMITPNKHA